MCLRKFYFYIIMFFTMTSISCEPHRLLRAMAASLPSEGTSTIDAVLLACPQYKSKRNFTESSSKKCQDQLIIHIKVNPSFHVEKCEKYLILDEAYEPHSRTKAKILSPYLIEISRGEPVMMYPLEFSKSMNCDSSGQCSDQNSKPSTANCQPTKCPVQKAKPCNSRPEHVTPSPKCAHTTHKPPVGSCKQQTQEDPCKQNTQKDPCKQNPQKDPCKQQTQEDPGKQHTQKDPCKQQTQEDPCKQNTQKDPCKQQTQEDPCKQHTQKDPCGHPTQEDPCKQHTQKNPCEQHRQEKPCGQHTQEKPCGQNTQQQPKQEDPCKQYTQKKPYEQHRQEDPCKQHKQEDPCKEHTQEDPCNQYTQKKPFQQHGQQKPYQQHRQGYPFKHHIQKKPCAQHRPKDPCKQHTQEKSKYVTPARKPSCNSCNQNFKLSRPSSSKRPSLSKKPCQSSDFLPLSKLVKNEHKKNIDSRLNSFEPGKFTNNQIMSENYFLKYNTNTNLNENTAESNLNLATEIEENPMQPIYNNADNKNFGYMDSSETTGNDSPIQFHSSLRDSKDSGLTPNFGIVDALNGPDLDLEQDIEEVGALENDNNENPMEMSNQNDYKYDMDSELNLMTGKDSTDLLENTDRESLNIDNIEGYKNKEVESDSDLNLLTGKDITELLETTGKESDNIGGYKYKEEESDINCISKTAALEPVNDDFKKRKLQTDEVMQSEPNDDNDDVNKKLEPMKKNVLEEKSYDNLYADKNEEQKLANDEDNENDIRNMEVKKFPKSTGPRHCKPKKPGKYVFQNIQLSHDKQVDLLKNSKTYKHGDKVEQGNELNQQSNAETWENLFDYNRPALIDPLDELMEKDMVEKVLARRKRSSNEDRKELIRNMFQDLIFAKDRKGNFNSKNMYETLHSAASYTPYFNYAKKDDELGMQNSFDNNIYSSDRNLNSDFNILKDPLSSDALNKYYYDISAYSRNFHYIPQEMDNNEQISRNENAEQTEEVSATSDPLESFNLKYNQRIPEFNNEYKITDPYLQFQDKLNFDSINPMSKDLNIKYSALSKKRNVPLVDGKTNVLKSENAKTKRSFLMYDDMETKDTLDDNDYIFEKFDSGLIKTRAVDDMQACDSCGGKKKKPPSQTNQQGFECDTTGAVEDMQACDSCGGKKKKPPSQIDKLLETQNVADNDGRLCTTCGGKNKKTDGKPSLHEEEDNGCQCRTLKGGPCFCKSKKSVKNTCYTVYKMSAPLPFLTTRVRIFRKCRNTWWKIAPTVTLNSLSAIYANKNLSIIFSSRVDIFQFEKSLRLQNHALLVPNKQDRQWPFSNSNVENYEELIQAIDLEQLNAHPEEMVQLDNGNKRSIAYDEQNLCAALGKVKKSNEHVNSWENLFLKDFNKAMDKFKYIVDNNLHSISDLGYVPSHTKVLSRCPQENKRLCFSVLEDKSPAYSIKIRMPFTQNTLIFPQASKVKITRIITDATTNNVLFIILDLINEGYVAKQFDVSLTQCPKAMSVKANDVKYSKKILLGPHIAETITFMLPLVVQLKQFYCIVIVKKTEYRKKRNIVSRQSMNSTRECGNVRNQGIVSTREMIVEPNSRCFCIWQCRCHCVKKIETDVDFEVCKIMDVEQLNKAGFLREGDKNRKPDMSSSLMLEDYIEKLKQFSLYAVLILQLTFLMGLLKAILGCCCQGINRFGFKYVKLGKCYEKSSKKRRFLINVFFFILLPFLCCCPCCTPAEQDLLLSKTSWRCKGGDNTMYFPCPDQSDDDEDIILQKLCVNKNKNPNRSFGGSVRSSNYEINLPEFNDLLQDDEDDDEANTRYILSALAESRQALKTMISHHSSQKFFENQNIDHEKYQMADEFVQSLKKSQIVYRIFSTPQPGLINILPGMKYCIRGYFLPSLGAAYEFVNYCPLAQYFCVSTDGHSMVKLNPPNYLSPDVFSKTYMNKIEVLEANELVVQEPEGVPCLNVLPIKTLDETISKLVASNSEDELAKMQSVIEPVLMSDTDESIDFADRRFLSPRISHRLFNIVECIEDVSDNDAQ